MGKAQVLSSTSSLHLELLLLLCVELLFLLHVFTKGLEPVGPAEHKVKAASLDPHLPFGNL